MKARIQLLALAAVVVAAMPTGTTGQADITRQPAAGCSTINQSAGSQLKAIMVIRDKQLTALRRANLRLTGLLSQADIQGHHLPKLAADQTELAQRLATITTGYGQLTAAVQALADNCQATSLAPASAALSGLRAQVVSLNQWYTDTLTVDLQGSGQ